MNENECIIESYRNTYTSTKNLMQIIDNLNKLTSLRYNGNYTADSNEIYNLVSKRSNNKRLINIDLITLISNRYTSYDYIKTSSNEKNKIINLLYKIGDAFGRTAYTLYNKIEEKIQNLITIRRNLETNRTLNSDINLSFVPVAKFKMHEDI